MAAASLHMLALAVGARSGEENPGCVASACREYSPLMPDDNCCGMWGSTFCARGFAHSKVLSTVNGGSWRVESGEGFFAGCPAFFGGITCCKPADHNLTCAPHACRDNGRFDRDCCGSNATTRCAEGYIKHDLGTHCYGNPEMRSYCCEPEAGRDSEDYGVVSTCPAETIKLLQAGIASGLCGDDYCSLEITYKLCKDWTECRVALVATYGEEAGKRTDERCQKATHGVAAAAVAIAVSVGGLLCIGVCVGVRCYARCRRGGRSKEERASLTRTLPADGATRLDAFPPATFRDPTFQSIESLKKLLDQGALNQKEFDAKKAELLSRV
jgi:hypothetical protein